MIENRTAQPIGTQPVGIISNYPKGYRGSVNTPIEKEKEVIKEKPLTRFEILQKKYPRRSKKEIERYMKTGSWLSAQQRAKRQQKMTEGGFYDSQPKRTQTPEGQTYVVTNAEGVKVTRQNLAEGGYVNVAMEGYTKSKNEKGETIFTKITEQQETTTERKPYVSSIEQFEKDKIKALLSKPTEQKIIEGYKIDRILSPQETTTTEKVNLMLIEPEKEIKEKIEKDLINKSEQLRAIESSGSSSWEDVKKTYELGIPLLVYGIGEGAIMVLDVPSNINFAKELITKPKETFISMQEFGSSQPERFVGGIIGSSIMAEVGGLALKEVGGVKEVQQIKTEWKDLQKTYTKGNIKEGLYDSARTLYPETQQVELFLKKEGISPTYTEPASIIRELTIVDKSGTRTRFSHPNVLEAETQTTLYGGRASGGRLPLTEVDVYPFKEAKISIRAETDVTQYGREIINPSQTRISINEQGQATISQFYPKEYEPSLLFTESKIKVKPTTLEELKVQSMGKAEARPLEVNLIEGTTTNKFLIGDEPIQTNLFGQKAKTPIEIMEANKPTTIKIGNDVFRDTIKELYGNEKKPIQHFELDKAKPTEYVSRYKIVEGVGKVEIDYPFKTEVFNEGLLKAPQKEYNKFLRKTATKTEPIGLGELNKLYEEPKKVNVLESGKTIIEERAELKAKPTTFEELQLEKINDVKKGKIEITIKEKPKPEIQKKPTTEIFKEVTSEEGLVSLQKVELKTETITKEKTKGKLLKPKKKQAMLESPEPEHFKQEYTTPEPQSEDYVLGRGKRLIYNEPELAQSILEQTNIKEPRLRDRFAILGRKDTRIKQEQPQIQQPFHIQKQEQPQIQQPKTTTKQVVSQIVSPDVMVDLVTKTYLEPITETITETKQEPITETKQEYKPFLRPKTELMPPKILVLGRTKQDKPKSRYITKVRKKGQFKIIGVEEDLARATSLGIRNVQHTASASFKIEEEGKGIVLKLPTSKRFYESKKEKGVNIQKKEFRISTRGEKEEITFKGIRSQALKSGIKLM